MQKVIYLFTAVFAFISLQVNAQRTVTGTVTSAEEGTTIPGVTVMAKNTVTGTVTDENGEYSITIGEEDETLVFSFVGLKTIEEPVEGRSIIDVTMEVDAIGIDEFVVIGYGSTRSEDLSVAASTVDVDDNFKGRPSSIGTLLQGEVTGVRVEQNSDPRGGAGISIRGKGNRSGDGVLYVVDGVPNAPFNPADVESVTVLKDAASAAIYGAYAGSGGVILITTKQAESGDVKVDVNAWNGVQQAWQLPEVLTAEQFNQVWNDASDLAGRQVPAVYDPLVFPYGNVTRTDWIDAVFRPGYMQHYDMSISGGTDQIKALASVSYDDVQGMIINTFNRNITSRLNLEMDLRPWIKMKQNFQYDFDNGQSNIGGGHTGALFAAMAYPRYATPFEYDADGNLLRGGTVPRWAAEDGFSVEADLFNPVTQLENQRQNNPRNRLLSVTSLRLKPLDGLEFKSDFAYMIDSRRNERFTARFTAPGRTVDQNYRSISNSLFNQWNWENILSYSKIFNDLHYVSILGGFTMNYTTERWNNNDTRGYDFEYENYTIFSNAGEYGYNQPGENIWEEATVSALGRASYSYDDRYFFTASLRRDASSKLSPDNNADIFPALSGAWKITSEPFMDQIPQISFMKLRASWGQVGNIRSVRRFIYAPPFSRADWGVFLGPDASNHVFGVYQSTIPNPDLKWERTEQTNIGVDVGLFNNSLFLTADYFYKLTKDLIETQPIPSVAGVASPPEINIGEVENYGWEFSAIYSQAIGEVLFNLEGNLGTVKNNVINIGDRDFISHGDDVNGQKPLQSEVGQPWHSYYLIESIGVFQSQSEIDNYTWTDPETGETQLIQPNAKPGDLKFADADDNGIINDGDRVYMGAYDFPDLSYGFSLGAEWKNFTFNMFWQGISGVKIYNGVKAMSVSGLKGWNMSTEVLDSWEYNPDSGVPRLSFIDDSNGNYSKVSSYFLEDGDYLRLKNLQIAYTLPSDLSARIGMGPNSRVRIYANGENLLTFTPYSAFDPEVGSRGVDRGTFPVARMYSVGVNVSF
ncbi:MAG: SusC/RagA family TonB-linked outer membrane protein [Bacteroidota bacterium]